MHVCNIVICICKHLKYFSISYNPVLPLFHYFNIRRASKITTKCNLSLFQHLRPWSDTTAAREKTGCTFTTSVIPKEILETDFCAISLREILGGWGSYSHIPFAETPLCVISLSTDSVSRTWNADSSGITYFVLAQVSSRPPVAILWWPWSSNFWASDGGRQDPCSREPIALCPTAGEPHHAWLRLHVLTGGIWTYHLSCPLLNISHSTVRFVRWLDNLVSLLVLAERDKTNKWLSNCCEWRLKLDSQHLWGEKALGKD